MSYVLGRHVNHDPRSRDYAYPTGDLTIADVVWKRRVPVFDQGHLGACTANAGLGCIATDPFFATIPAGEPLDEAQAVDVYSAATQIDPFPGQYKPDDTGSDGVSVAKVLVNRGLISGYQHTFNLTDALKALTTQPVMCGTNWYEGMFHPDESGIVHPTGAIAGGHEYLLDEIDTGRGLVGFTNSWGESWGIKGRGYMTFDTLSKLLSEQGDITVLTPLNKPAPVPTPPAPVPADELDAAMWNDIKTWVHAHHYGQVHLATARLIEWAKARGLE